MGRGGGEGAGLLGVGLRCTPFFTKCGEVSMRFVVTAAGSDGMFCFTPSCKHGPV